MELVVSCKGTIEPQTNSRPQAYQRSRLAHRAFIRGERILNVSSLGTGATDKILGIHQLAGIALQSLSWRILYPHGQLVWLSDGRVFDMRAPAERA